MASRMSRSARGRWAAQLVAAALLLLAAVLRVDGASAQTLKARIAACVACHGEKGLSPNPNTPSIGVQPNLLVIYQQFFYREGRRSSSEMSTVARGLSYAELTALADEVAQLPPPPAADGPME